MSFSCVNNDLMASKALSSSQSVSNDGGSAELQEVLDLCLTNVKYENEEGCIYLTNIRTFFLSNKIILEKEELSKCGLDLSLNKFIGSWKKSEKSKKVNKVKISFGESSEVDSLESRKGDFCSQSTVSIVLDFKDKRDNMEKYCSRLLEIKKFLKDENVHVSFSKIIPAYLLSSLGINFSASPANLPTLQASTSSEKNVSNVDFQQLKDVSYFSPNSSPNKNFCRVPSSLLPNENISSVGIVSDELSAPPAKMLKTKHFKPETTANDVALLLNSSTSFKDYSKDSKLDSLNAALSSSLTKSGSSSAPSLTPTPKFMIKEKNDNYAQEKIESEKCAERMKEIACRRKEILEKNEDIKNFYNYFVKKQFLTEEEFWERHKEEVLLQLDMKNKANNELSSFLAAPLSMSQNSSKIPFPSAKNTAKNPPYPAMPQHTDAILKEDSKINKIYHELVRLNKVNPNEFWTRFFQTKYYHQFIGQPITNNMVDDIAGIDLGSCHFTPNLNPAIVQQISNPAVEILSTEALRKRGFGTVESLNLQAGEGVSFIDHGKTVKCNNIIKADKITGLQSLIERFNRHSSSVIKKSESLACLTYPDSDSHNCISENEKFYITAFSQNRYEKINKILQEEINFDDLKKSKNPSYIPIEATRSELYAASCKKINKESKEEILKKLDKNWLKEKLLKSLEKAKEKQIKIQENFKPSEMYEGGRTLFVFNTKMCQSEKAAQIASLEYDDQTVTTVKANQKRVIELLQHFYYSTLPEVDKRVRIMNALYDTQREIEYLQNKTYSATAKALYAPIFDILNAAKLYDSKIKTFVEDFRAKNRAAKARGEQQRCSAPASLP